MNPHHVEISDLTGPLFIGSILAWGLFGVLSVQVYLYFQVFAHDPILLKLLVYLIYILEFVQIILMTSAFWKQLVHGFGVVQLLEAILPEGWIATSVIGGIVALCVQVFYAYRIAKLSQNVYMSCVIIIISIISFAGAVGSGIIAGQNHNSGQRHDLNMKLLPGMWFAGGSLCDILIALSMCYYLRKGVQGISFKSTRRLISQITRLTLETGTLTATLSVISSVLFYTPTLNTDWEVPVTVTAELYATTLLFMLNSRMNLSLAASETNGVSWDSTPFRSGDSTPVSKPVISFTNSDGAVP